MRMRIRTSQEGAEIEMRNEEAIPWGFSTGLSKSTTESQATRTGEWNLPRPKGKYMRASVIELLPDPLSPLFATLGLPAWNRAMYRFAQAVGIGTFSNAMLTTINDYAFYDSTYRTALMRPRVLL